MRHPSTWISTVFGREYLFCKQLYDAGQLGELTLYRGYHVQNLDGFPNYWQGYPPMQYVTHALSPLLALTGRTVAEVTAYGSGRLADERAAVYGNPFPTEVGVFRLHDHMVRLEASARAYGFPTDFRGFDPEVGVVPGDRRLLDVRTPVVADVVEVVGRDVAHGTERVRQPFAHEQPEALARGVAQPEGLRRGEGRAVWARVSDRGEDRPMRDVDELVPRLGVETAQHSRRGP
jgi:hypothetical protein